MNRHEMTRKFGTLASLALLLVGFVGCSVDSPTAPDQVPAPPPTIGGNNWNISVTVTPDELDAGSAEPASVVVDVEAKADGSNPPNGTTMTLSTSLGEFSTAGSGVTSLAVVIDRGKATALLFPGSIVASGSVTARLEGSLGRGPFVVLGEPEDPFITSILPSTGSAGGGTSVTILGVGFRENARVFFGGKLGQIVSSSETRIVVISPPGDMNTETCGEDNQGIRQVDTPVTVTLEFPDGGAESLANGFTYLASGGCIGG